MIANLTRRAMVALAILAMLVVALEANAACCGGGTTAFYPSSTVAAYSPVAYQTNYSGWYPGYWWNRIGTRLWGSPSTYVTAYPTTFATSFAPTYSVGYRPMYSAGYATSYAAPAGCASCQSQTVAYPSCSTCGVQQVTMRPVCTTACSSPCANGAAQSQTTGTTSSPSPDPAVPPTFDMSKSPSESTNGAPSIESGSSVSEEREGKKPPTNETPPDIQPGPGDDANETKEYDPYLEGSDSGASFEAPKLHDPNDRTAQRAIRPVTTAVYTQPVSHRVISTRPVSAEQAQRDAVGWTSASK